MMTAAKWVLGIVPAGIALGALLGAAANPHMKDAPAPWWRLTGAEPFASSEPAPEEWTEDLAASRSYRPDLDYGIEVWTLPVPASELMALADEPLTPPPATEPRLEDGDEAEGAADAITAEASASDPAPELAEVRKAELAQAGLY